MVDEALPIEVVPVPVVLMLVFPVMLVVPDNVAPLLPVINPCTVSGPPMVSPLVLELKPAATTDAYEAFEINPLSFAITTPSSVLVVVAVPAVPARSLNVAPPEAPRVNRVVPFVLKRSGCASVVPKNWVNELVPAFPASDQEVLAGEVQVRETDPPVTELTVKTWSAVGAVPGIVSVYEVVPAAAFNPT